MLSLETEEIALSGVGLFDDDESGAYIAPINSEGRWDDPDYNRPLTDEFGAGCERENNRHGFLFHDSCWKLLEVALLPEMIPLHRLYELCLSLPRPPISTCVSWGHDYGGLVAIDNKNYYPWDQRDTEREIETHSSVHESSSDEEDESSGLGIPAADRLPLPDGDEDDMVAGVDKRVPDSDPFDVPGISNLLAEAEQVPPTSGVSLGAYDAARDTFLKLPEELRICIAVHLTTMDALNARYASKAFWSLYYTQQFWASRFGRNSERSWLFELELSDEPRDWRWLFRRTNDTHISMSPAIQNRVRVWSLALRLVEVLRLESSQSLPTMMANSDTSGSDPGLPWITASALIVTMRSQPSHSVLLQQEGCRVLHRQRLMLADLGRLSSIGLSFVRVGDKKYLAGLRLVKGSGESTLLGFRSSDEKMVEVSTLRGFNLAIGSRGIQAVQFVKNSETQSMIWYGESNDAPKCARIASRQEIAGMEIGFDVCLVAFPTPWTSPCGQPLTCQILSGMQNRQHVITRV